MERAVKKIDNVAQNTAAESGRSRSAGNAAKTTTVHLEETARTENVLRLDLMAIAVFLTQTVPLETAVVSGPPRSAGNAAKTRTVQQGKTAKTKNVSVLDLMTTHVFPILTVPLATAAESFH